MKTIQLSVSTRRIGQERETWEVPYNEPENFAEACSLIAAAKFNGDGDKARDYCFAKLNEQLKTDTRNASRAGEVRDRGETKPLSDEQVQRTLKRLETMKARLAAQGVSV